MVRSRLLSVPQWVAGVAATHAAETPGKQRFSQYNTCMARSHTAATHASRGAVAGGQSREVETGPCHHACSSLLKPHQPPHVDDVSLIAHTSTQAGRRLASRLEPRLL